jgi:ectoine hydroxylase-related dioxygenase (phytanoyl-CoA dioxygenase family)
MVIPGSHKSNLIHPAIEDRQGGGTERSLDNVKEAVQVQLEAGDAAFFVDCLAHGSSERVNEGERRIAIIRYGPHWGSDRYGFQPSPELLERLTPDRRKIVQPLPPRRPPEV